MEKSDFTMLPNGFGSYKVEYSNSRNTYKAIITDMTLIDAVKYADEPKKKDLIALRSAVIRNSI